MNTLKYQNNDEKKIVDILDNAYAAKFLEKYQSFVKYTGLSELKIDFSVYGRLDRIQQKEFNNLRKQSFISIPENAFQVETNRFNKRKWKRKHDSKRKTKKLPRQDKSASNIKTQKQSRTLVNMRQTETRVEASESTLQSNPEELFTQPRYLYNQEALAQPRNLYNQEALYTQILKRRCLHIQLQ